MGSIFLYKQASSPSILDYKKITPRNNGYKNHFYLKYVEKEALFRTNRGYFPPNVSMYMVLSTTISLSSCFEAHVPISYRFL